MWVDFIGVPINAARKVLSVRAQPFVFRVLLRTRTVRPFFPRARTMPSAPRTVKDVPAQEFVIALAQYFRSTGKVSTAIFRHPRCPSGENAVLRDAMHGTTP